MTCSRKQFVRFMLLPLLHFSAYQVIILKVVDEVEKLPDDYDSKLKHEENFYITAEIPNNPVFEKSWEFTVGNGNTHGGFGNKALERGEEYIIFQRAVTKDNGVSKVTQF